MKKLKGFLNIVNIVFITAIAILVIYLILDAAVLNTYVTNMVNNSFFSKYSLIPVIFAIIILMNNIGIIIAFSKNDKSKESIQISNATGIIRISAHSIESLVKLEARTMEDISDIRTNIFIADNKADLEVFAKVPPTVSIPDLSLELQNRIKNKIINTTGIEIESVKVIIDGILEVTT